MLELLLVFAVVYAAFQIGRALQWFYDAKNVLGKGNDRSTRR